jgi:hypothetical protein
MAAGNRTIDRIYDYDGTFLQGMVSSTDVGMIPLGAYDWSMNMVHRGGVLMCRPGYKCLVTMPSGRLQGAAIYSPKTGVEQVLVVIEGVLYVADWPFTGDFRQVTSVLFSPDAPQVYFQMCEQSVSRIEPTFESAISFITPKNVMIIQDGGFTAPVWYDGQRAEHERGNEWGIPIGGPMAWVGDRLWVANKSFVYASDIANPLSFREQLYLGGISAFVMPGNVTGMAVTPSIDLQQLIVFTEFNATLLQANVRDRSNWENIEGFQTQVYEIGCTSHRSIVNHYGQLWWFSPQGLMNIDMAAQSKVRSRLEVRDIEMTDSSIGLDSDLSEVAGAAFGNYILMSVPHEDVFNKHTWVLDNSAAQSLRADIGPTWSGYWTGTRPVQWMYGQVAGKERIFYVSKDLDGENRLWTAFEEERLDNGCPITWAFATRGYFGLTSQVPYPQGRDKKFCFAEMALCEIEGSLDVASYYAGGTRGPFKQVMTKNVRAALGSIQADDILTYNSTLFAFKPQSRRVKTEDVREQNQNDLSSCPVESDKVETIDDTFQLVVVGQGRAGVRWIRAVGQTHAEDNNGSCEKDEADYKAVRFDGAAKQSTVVNTAEASLLSSFYYFESTQQKILTTDDGYYQAIGFGSATSVISQKAADRAAEAIATQYAEKYLRDQIPPFLSDGSGVE